MKITLWSEHTLRHGEEYHGENPYPDDTETYDGSPKELLAIADDLLKSHHTSFAIRAARTIREFVADEENFEDA
jgi:hypothetical protein